MFGERQIVDISTASIIVVVASVSNKHLRKLQYNLHKKSNQDPLKSGQISRQTKHPLNPDPTVLCKSHFDILGQQAKKIVIIQKNFTQVHPDATYYRVQTL